MAAFLSNAFNDPSNPWYYVIGVLFLLLVFAALAAYIFISGKKNKSNNDGKAPSETTAKDEGTEPTVNEQSEINPDVIIASKQEVNETEEE